MGMIFLFAAALLVKYAQSMLLTEPEIRSGKLSQERGSIFDRNGKILAAATTLYQRPSYARCYPCSCYRHVRIRVI